VEAVLAGHPGIADAGVFAAQMPGGRARLLAAVVAREGFDEKAALAFCRERLGTAAPERLLVVPALPRNAAGKLLRRELSQRVRIRRPGDRSDDGGVPPPAVH
jgi:acyl-coenzyme A synthetase/AMP-(fatty) acid ligase